ncbi:MAG TPA: hypothetical protein VJG32_22520 [Anaerolineae bacterium]|nr:hypothetical protein [Anaerolineae bacterium]
MLRRSALSVVLALLVALALALPAFAGGVVVSVDQPPPPDIGAGEPFTVGFTVISAHDGSPESGLEPTITTTNPNTKEKITVTARREGAAGHYVATLTLPAEGEWNWEIQPFGRYGENYPASVMTPISVRAGAVQSAPAETATPIAPSTALWPTLGVLLLAAGAAAIVMLRARRRAAART